MVYRQIAQGDDAQLSSLITDEASINDSAVVEGGEAPVETLARTTEVGTFDGRAAATADAVGTRELAAVWDVTPDNSPATTTSTTFENTRSDIWLGAIPAKPNKVPVLQILINFTSNDDGETYTFRIRNDHNDEVLMSFQTGSGTAVLNGFEETYLTERAGGTAAMKTNTQNFRLVPEHKVTGGSTGGEVRPETTVKLLYEVV